MAEKITKFSQFLKNDQKSVQFSETVKTSKKPSFISHFNQKEPEEFQQKAQSLILEQKKEKEKTDINQPISLKSCNYQFKQRTEKKEWNEKEFSKPKKIILQQNLEKDFENFFKILKDNQIELDKINMNKIQEIFDFLNQYQILDFVKFVEWDILINCKKMPEELKDLFLDQIKNPLKFFEILKCIFYVIIPDSILFQQKNTNQIFFENEQKIIKTQKEETQINQIKKIQPSQNKKINLTLFNIRIFYWNFLDNQNIHQKQVNNFLFLKGIILYLSPINVLVNKMSFKCSQCGLTIEIVFKNFIVQYPKQCQSCLSSQFYPLKKTSQITLVQRAKLQEIEIKDNDKPLLIFLELKGNLIDCIEIGSHVEVCGILKPEIVNKDDFLGKKQNQQSGLFTFFIEVNSILQINEKIQNFIEKPQQLQNQNFSSDTKFPLTSQLIFENSIESQQNGLYLLNLDKKEKQIFDELFEKEIIFEALVYFFCPNLQQNYLEKALLVLSLIWQENPIHILFYGKSGCGKTSLLKFTEEIAHKSLLKSNLSLFPVLEKNTGFERTINPGKLALSNNGIICLDDVDKINKTDLIILSTVMKSKSVSIKKYPQMQTLPANVSILASLQSNCEYDKIQQKNKLPVFFLNAFDFIVQMDNTPAKFITNFSRKFFKNNQKTQFQTQQTQIQKQILEKGFSFYIHDKAQQLEFDNKYQILKNQQTYKNLQLYIQNNVQPVLEKEIGLYMKEFFIEFKKEFKININVNFFETILKLLIARAKIEKKEIITIQMADEIIELIKEFFNKNDKENSQNISKKSQQKNLSENQKQNLFLKKIKEISINNQNDIFEKKDLEQIQNNLNLQLGNLDNLIEKFADKGILLKKSKDIYQFYGIN